MDILLIVRQGHTDTPFVLFWSFFFVALVILVSSVTVSRERATFLDFVGAERSGVIDSSVGRRVGGRG
jgi:hypothetical protein